jgi:hypothetical protein
MRRKKVEKDEEYIATVANLAKSVDHAMRQNTALDIYEVCVVEPALDRPFARAIAPAQPHPSTPPTGGCPSANSLRLNAILRRSILLTATPR